MFIKLVIIARSKTVDRNLLQFIRYIEELVSTKSREHG